MTQKRATVIGLLAVVLWSSIVGLIRGVSESFGATGGAALIYTVASVLLLATIGFPKLRSVPRPYLIWGGMLFVSYELCLALSIGYANSSQQAIEVSMINYLWPTFTMLSFVYFTGQRANLLIVPGCIVSLLGIAWVLGGQEGIDVHGTAKGFIENPLSYCLAFIGALLWAAYCTITKKLSNGKNCVTLFFSLVAVTLWLKYLLFSNDILVYSFGSITLLAMAASALGLGYAAWNIGILHGNTTIISAASYFTPVLSAALAAILLRTPLSLSFWQGALMVCGGSILCWLATRTASRKTR